LEETPYRGMIRKRERKNNQDQKKKVSDGFAVVSEREKGKRTAGEGGWLRQQGRFRYHPKQKERG